MGGSYKNFCIKCDSGGKVLVCSNSSCPLAVHEKCLGFPAKFDEMGKFYCPYCIYRKLVEESHRAREKALSRKKALFNFLDRKLINGDCQAQGFGNSKCKETMNLLDARKYYDPHLRIVENRVNKVSVPKHAILDKEGERQDGFASESGKRVIQSQKADTLGPGNHPEGLSSNVARACGCDHRLGVVGHQTEAGPKVASGEDYVGSEDEETVKRFEVVDIDHSIPLQPQQKQDDYHPQSRVENHLEGNNSVDPPVTEKHGNENFFKARNLGTDARTVQETIDNNEVTENMEEQVVRTTALSYGDPALGVHLLEKRVSEASGVVHTEAKRFKSDDNSRDKSSNENCFRTTSQHSASKLRAYVDHLEEIIASGESRRLTAPISTINFYSNGRRRSLPWTVEEVNMLKEGVDKFSTTGKNIPWRKILQFGRHVFDGTRTPVDLKDKWRRDTLGKRDNRANRG